MKKRYLDLNKKAEVNTYIIIAAVVVIGLILFLGVRYFFFNNQEPLNVTQINDSTISTSIQTIAVKNGTPIPGGVNLSDGTNLVLKNPIENVNNTNKTLVKVIYPNRTMTPGDVMSINITEICVSGYSDSIRDVSQATKDAVYREYLLSPEQPEGAFEIDHLIPLSIGGSNDIKNLWPQPVDPRPGYKEKDRLETYYHKQVCDGKMDLEEAQAIMANNWFQGYVDVYTAGGFS